MTDLLLGNNLKAACTNADKTSKNGSRVWPVKQSQNVAILFPKSTFPQKPGAGPGPGPGGGGGGGWGGEYGKMMVTPRQD